MACHLFSPKPSSESMLAHLLIEPLGTSLSEILNNNNNNNNNNNDNDNDDDSDNDNDNNDE